MALAGLRRAGVRRSAWVVVDQGVSSATNLAVTIAAARSVDRSSFGAFSVAFVLSSLVLAVNRALVAQPLAVRASSAPEPQGEVAAAASATVVCGAVLGAVLGAAAVIVGGEVGAALAVTGFLLPGLLLQDTWRVAFFTMSRATAAVVNDLVWAGALLIAIAAVVATGGDSAPPLAAAWAGGATVAAVFGLRQAEVRLSWSQGVDYLRRHVRLGGLFAADQLVATGSVQATILLIGTMLGPDSVGAVRGGQALFGPYTVACLGLSTAGVCEGSRLLARAPGRLRPVLALVSALLMLVAVAWGAALVLLPAPWGVMLLGPTWPSARQLVVPLTVMTAGGGVAVGGLLGLRVSAAGREGLQLRTVAAVATVVGGLVGGVRAGAAGAVWGLALGNWTSAALAWRSLRRLPRHRRNA